MVLESLNVARRLDGLHLVTKRRMMELDHACRVAVAPGDHDRDDDVLMCEYEQIFEDL